MVSLTSTYFDLLYYCCRFFPEHRSTLHDSNKTESEVYEIIFACSDFIQPIFKWNEWLSRAQIATLLLGAVLNLFILSILLAGSPKTATDIYLISITLGDIVICGASAVNGDHLPVAFEGIWKEAVAEVLGSLGEYNLDGPEQI